ERDFAPRNRIPPVRTRRGRVSAGRPGHRSRTGRERQESPGGTRGGSPRRREGSWNVSRLRGGDEELIASASMNLILPADQRVREPSRPSARGPENAGGSDEPAVH